METFSSQWRYNNLFLKLSSSARFQHRPNIGRPGGCRFHSPSTYQISCTPKRRTRVRQNNNDSEQWSSSTTVYRASFEISLGQHYCQSKWSNR